MSTCSGPFQVKQVEQEHLKIVHVKSEQEHKKKRRGSFNASLDDAIDHLLPQAVLYNVCFLDDFSYSSVQYCILPFHTREVCLEHTVSLGFFGISLFGDVVTKPCCADGCVVPKWRPRKETSIFSVSHLAVAF